MHQMGAKMNNKHDKRPHYDLSFKSIDFQSIDVHFMINKMDSQLKCMIIHFSILA